MAYEKIIEIYETELKEAEEWIKGTEYYNLPQSVRLMITRGIVNTEGKLNVLKKRIESKEKPTSAN